MGKSPGTNQIWQPQAVVSERPETNLSLLDVNMKRLVEPGDFGLLVGPNSAEITNVTLTVEPG